jgi:beta-xylosidase
MRFEYVRFHGLLQDELGVYSEDRQGRPVYNFQYVDAIYDAILNAGMRPFVEFGFMPQKLASGEKTIFWWKGQCYAAARLREMGGSGCRARPTLDRSLWPRRGAAAGISRFGMNRI